VNNAAKRKIEQEARVKAQFAERERMEAMDPAERRRDFIKREMAKIDAFFAKTDSERPSVAADIRRMEECPEKDVMRKRLDAEIARLSETSAKTPLRLSDAALATPMIGIHSSAQTELERPA
jgi:membrane protein involved in colicin uptake